jgi:hypothetical protein
MARTHPVGTARAKPRMRRVGDAVRDAARDPAGTSRYALERATDGLERLGEQIMRSAEFARRASVALSDVGESLLRAAQQARVEEEQATDGGSRRRRSPGRTGRRGTRTVTPESPSETEQET